MRWEKDKFKLIEEKNFIKIAKKCNTESQYIVRAVSVWHDEILCGYFITCESFGIRSFHGFKFVKGGLEFQIPMARKYIEEEGLKISMYDNSKTRAILKVLGFKEVFNQNGNCLAMKR